MLIRQRLIIIFLAITIIPISFVSILIFYNTRDALLSSYFAKLEIVADLKRDKIEHYFEDLKSNVQIAQDYFNIKTNLPIVTEYSRDRINPEYIKAEEMLDRQLKTWLKVKKEVADFVLLSPEGKIVYTANEAHRQRHLDLPLPGSGDKAFEEGKKGVYVSQIYRNSDPEFGYNFGMLVTAPVYSFDKKLVGVIAFEINADHIYKFIQDTTGLGETGETLLVRKEGDHVLFLNPLRHDPGGALTRKIHFGDKMALPAQMASKGENGSGVVRDYRNKEAVAVWRYIPTSDWGLVTKTDMQEALAPIIALRNSIVIICVIVLFSVGVMAIAIADAISKPIRLLHKSTEIIGRGNLDYKVGTDVQDEIGQFSRAFDQMVGNLKKITASRDELSREIAERKKLQETHRNFEAIIESANDAIIGKNSEGIIISWNRGAEVIFGYNAKEVVGKSISLLMPPTHTDEFKEVLAKISHGEDIKHYETKRRRKDGQIIDISLTVSPVKDAFGEIIGVSAICRDITERKQIEKELEMAKIAAESANRTKSDFLANMSHELRTPLNAVIGFSEVLYDQKFGPLNETQKDYLNDILESGKYLLSLINDILDLAKIESGKIELVLSNCSLKEILEHSLVFIKEEALKHNIELSLDVAEEIGYIRADERKVKQIIYNLLSNAVKFTPNSGKIGINAKTIGSETEVTVWDTGIGISKEDQNKLFGEFVQLEDPLTKKYEGSGLGLALTKKLVELHEGKIWVESEGKNKGSSFKFTLPIKGGK